MAAHLDGMTTKTLAPEQATTASRAPVSPLTAIDRCDRCGAQAYVVTEHAAGRLLWCAHHHNQHRTALKPSVVQDETHLLHDVNRAYKNGE